MFVVDLKTKAGDDVRLLGFLPTVYEQRYY